MYRRANRFTRSSTTAMTHVAIAEALNGKAVEWIEPVSDAQYLAGRQATAA